ncbi:MAG: hypothetical protein JWM91_2982 [Rhodospirillales bacterium]|nr:hypothetical protein [Rhodospirillales bacterium]
MSVEKNPGAVVRGCIALARRWARLVVFLPVGLTGCHTPRVLSEQDALYCEAQGLRPGSDANFNCAVKREADREQDGGVGAVAQPALTLPLSAEPLRPPAHPGGVSQITPKSLAPGTTETINFSISVNADCVFTGMPTVRIDKQPANGTVRVSQRIDFARLSQNGVPVTCGDKKISGISVEYTPNKNYVGSDVVEFATMTRLGRTAFKVPITVEKPSQEE